MHRLKLLSKQQHAFTVTELVIVAIILALIIGIALPNFSKTKTRAFERDAIAQLNIFHEANKFYFSREGEYLPADTSGDLLSYVNDELNINLAENDSTLAYAPGAGDTYTASLAYSDITVQITQNEDSLCCSTDNCPTLPDC